MLRGSCKMFRAAAFLLVCCLNSLALPADGQSNQTPPLVQSGQLAQGGRQVS
jgi:hypothetical protein